MRHTGKRIFGLLLLAAAGTTGAFEWPQAYEGAAASFFSYFAQLRGGVVSSSVVFAGQSDVTASDDGRVTVVITDFRDQSGFFPSALGNAVILAHRDGLVTVYGNLGSDSARDGVLGSEEIRAGETLGRSGDSAWRSGESSLEFQVIDVRNNTAINPRIILPRAEKELPLTLSGVTLRNRNGRSFDIQTQRTLPAGLYKIYRTRQDVAVPYKTAVSVNGAAGDEISYEQLREADGMSYAAGRRNYYRRSDLYPDDTAQLMGEASLVAGRNSLTLSVSDILGKTTTLSYTLSAY